MRNSFIRVINQLDPNEFIIQSDWPIVSFYPIASFLNQNAGRLPSYALSIQTMLTWPAMRRSMSQESADCDRVTITWENETFFFLYLNLMRNSRSLILGYKRRHGRMYLHIL